MTSDPIDNLFWREVRAGYDKVATNNDMTIEVEKAGLSAHIYPTQNGVILIAVKEVDTEIKEPLIVPPNQGKNEV